MRKDIKNLFKNKVTKELGVNRIVSLLYFGSRAFDINVCVDSDYDFMLVLDEYKNSDILKLQKIRQSAPFSSLKMNINLMYIGDVELRGKENFQVRSVQSNFYSYLENAQILLGTNTFKDNPLKLSPNKITNQMDFKIQEYYGRCDKITLHSKPSGKLYGQLQKYTREILRMLLVREHLMSIHDIVDTSYKNVFRLIVLGDYLPKSMEKDLLLLLKEKVSASEIGRINRVRRKTYEKYLTLFARFHMKM